MTITFSKQLVRLSRAYELVRELLATIDQWCSQSSSEWSIKKKLSADCCTSDFFLDLPTTPPVEDWGVRFGEIVHHFRATLDNAVLTIARNCEITDLTTLNKLLFPICSTEKEWKSSKRSRNIDLLPAKFGNIIEEMQPFKGFGNDQSGGKNLLEILRDLDNLDKHHLQVIANISLPQITADMLITFATEEDAAQAGSPEITFISNNFTHGTLLYRLHVKRPIQNIAGSQKVSAIVHTNLNEQTLNLDILTSLYTLINLMINLLQFTDDPNSNSLGVLRPTSM